MGNARDSKTKTNQKLSKKKAYYSKKEKTSTCKSKTSSSLKNVGGESTAKLQADISSCDSVSQDAEASQCILTVDDQAEVVKPGSDVTKNSALVPKRNITCSVRPKFRKLQIHDSKTIQSKSSVADVQDESTSKVDFVTSSNSSSSACSSNCRVVLSSDLPKDSACSSCRPSDNAAVSNKRCKALLQYKGEKPDKQQTVVEVKMAASTSDAGCKSQQMPPLVEVLLLEKNSCASAERMTPVDSRSLKVLREMMSGEVKKEPVVDDQGHLHKRFAELNPQFLNRIDTQKEDCNETFAETASETPAVRCEIKTEPSEEFRGNITDCLSLKQTRIRRDKKKKKQSHQYSKIGVINFYKDLNKPAVGRKKKNNSEWFGAISKTDKPSDNVRSQSIAKLPAMAAATTTSAKPMVFTRSMNKLSG